MAAIPRTHCASRPSFAERERLLWDVSRRYVKGQMPRAERWAYEQRFGYSSRNGMVYRPDGLDDDRQPEGEE